MDGSGGRPVEEGVKGIVWTSTLPDDGPTGVSSLRGNLLSDKLILD
jgi:hypothetical protein